MRKTSIWSLVMLFLFSLYSPAYASYAKSGLNNQQTTVEGVTTFGFNDHRTRVAEGTEPVLWPAWKDDSGTSYSQPLILKGWGQYEGQTLVVAVTGNQLRGYVCKEPNGKIDESGFQQNNPLWSIPLMGDKPTKSHPTLVKKDNDKRYIYIGTEKHKGKTGYLQIIDVTDFDKAKGIYEFEDQWSSDIVSAPLVLNWRGHEVVVYTAGNTAEVHLAVDPLKSTDRKVGNFRIKVADSGRTSSSPAPVFNGQGFVVGLDRGPSGKGEFQIYRLDDILQEVNGKVELKSSKAYKAVTTYSSLVASFSVDGDWIYFGDQWSRVYGYNIKTDESWFNDDNKGIFSNRSPALTRNTVYFPAVGRPGQKGKLLSVDRNTHNTNWTTSFDDRAQTAPAVWIIPGIGSAAILEGVGNGYLAIINAKDGTKQWTLPVAPKNQNEAYATGITGEISVYDNWVVVTTEKGVKAWYAQPLDIEVTSLDPGCPKNAQGYIVKPGEKYKATAKIRANKLIIPGLPVPVGAFNELGNTAYKAVLKDSEGNELPKLSQEYPLLNNDDQYLVFKNQGEEITVTFEWTGAEKGTQHIAVGANLDYPIASPQLKNLWPETTLENNLKRVSVAKDNLWVEILDYTKEAQVGGTATVRARIHNERGELLTSRLVWKVNGVVMKDIPNYDIIGTLENSLTFTMPKDAAVVTVEINPDRNKPANETSYEDNKATCTVKPIAVVIPPDNESNRLKIKISAPSRVKAFYEKWKYTVTVTTNYPPPPPAPGGPNPKPPTITMNVSATGQTADMEVGYQIWNNGYQKIIPVKKTDKKVFSAGWGYREHKFIYEYPNTGLWGKPVTVTIKADAVSSEGQSARDTAIVTINPHPIPQTELQLIE